MVINDVALLSISGRQSVASLSEKQKLQQEQMDIKCLQVLRGIVHNEIVKLPPNWTTDVKNNKRSVVYCCSPLSACCMGCLGFDTDHGRLVFLLFSDFLSLPPSIPLRSISQARSPLSSPRQSLHCPLSSIFLACPA